VRDIQVPLPNALARGRLRRERGESGAALVEFALVVGLFMLILYGLISYGMILATKQRVTNAASEAARSAVGEANDAAAISVATARVTALLGAAGNYTPTVTTAACGTSTCVKVKIDWDYKNHPVVPPAPGLGLVTPDHIISEAQVQYK
jgi:Flp pilus assembly protein TadG